MAWTGISQAIARLEAMNAKVDAATRLTTIQVAADVEAKAKENFVGSHAPHEPHIPNGPPDRPNIVSGTLRRSIRATPLVRTAGGYTTTVAPNTEYGRRVELGFKGTDSLGRRYNQKAYPYFRPAAQDKIISRANGIALANWRAATSL